MGRDKFFTVSDTAAGAVLSGAANQTPISYRIPLL